MQRKYLITFELLGMVILTLSFSPLYNPVTAQEERPPGTSSDTLAYLAAINTPVSPEAAAAAIGVESGDLISATFNGSDSRGIGVGTTPLGHFFPTDGDTFLILSTGQAADAELANISDDLSTSLGGLNNSQSADLVQLELNLKVPNDMTCAGFDFAFYSEEFPEFVGSSFNDAFTAELGGFNQTIIGNTISAPWNFAFDTEGNIISVNTVFSVTAETGTTYDGATPSLRAQTPVNPGSSIVIVLSVQDLGDSIYDSAAFIDNFFWSDDPGCVSGAIIVGNYLFLPLNVK
jgi:hypothetical protein